MISVLYKNESLFNEDLRIERAKILIFEKHIYETRHEVFI